MLCAACSAALAPRRTAYGVVWVCARCGTGAATVPVIRKVVPRGFLQHLWQAARLHGRPSTQRCPSCTQPLSTFDGSPVEVSPVVSICCHCFFVVLERSALVVGGPLAPRQIASRSPTA
jgi:hypothetical protein